MLTESLAMEHYRLHLIERWPAGGAKDAALAAVRSTLESLVRDASPEFAHWCCIVCGARVVSDGHRRALAIAA